jgi:hypothetical protein
MLPRIYEIANKSGGSARKSGNRHAIASKGTSRSWGECEYEGDAGGPELSDLELSPTMDAEGVDDEESDAGDGEAKESCTRRV